MSLEKIIERIKRIENNDFVINEDISFEPGQLDRLRDKLDATDTTGQTNKNSKRQQKDIRVMGKANANAYKTNQIAKQGLSGFNHVNVGNVQHIPQKDEYMVFGVYDILRKYGLLSGYINNHNQATKGYSENEYQLLLNPTRKEIQLFFKYSFEDVLPDSNVLERMSIHFEYGKFNAAPKMNAVISDLRANAQSLHINPSSIDYNGNDNILKIYFN